MTEPFEFVASVEKVQTLADGAIRVTLDMPADSEIAAAKLMLMRRLQLAIRVTAEAVDVSRVSESLENSEHGKAKVDKRTTRSPLDMASR